MSSESAIVTSRVPLAVRRLAEAAAAKAGMNLSRWTCEAIEEKAARELLDGGRRQAA